MFPEPPMVTMLDFDPRTSTPGRTPLFLRVVAFSIFFFPSSMVLAPVGAAGTMPLMLALILFAFWFCSVLFGLHDPFKFRHPGRIGLALLLLGTCASYVALYLGLTGGSSIAARAASDRWVILLVASAGIILVTAEVVRTIGDVLLLIRAVLAGAFFCCMVAAVQFIFHINPMDWFQLAMPGFTDNGSGTTFQVRGTLVRVSGSTFHSIELAVVSSMLLPLSIWRGLFDPVGRKWLHWTGTGLLVFAIAATVSRAGIIGLLVGMIVFIPFLPQLARRWAFLVVPIAAAGLFLAVPGLIATIAGSFSTAESDPSISTRTNNYPRVIEMVGRNPILGLGPGNYIPDNALHILDNQYLNSAVTLGLVGLVAITAYFVLPGAITVSVARRARSQALKCLAGAVAAGGLVAAVCSLTFDSLSFPVFALTYPLFVGLAGAVWLMVKREIELFGPRNGNGPPFRKTPVSVHSTPEGRRWIP
ncbi:O-antigen ligase family protein [Arthrobacter sp. NPDC080073]|uniref:O-antigen ligase family protein n=1 Tax=Arthrobacter sp. NPDC080073 TaxID=3155919 RepID=UPI0034326199